MTLALTYLGVALVTGAAGLASPPAALLALALAGGLAVRLTRRRLGWGSLGWALFLAGVLGLAAGTVLRDARRQAGGARLAGLSGGAAASHPEAVFVEVRSPRRLDRVEGVSRTVTRSKLRESVQTRRVWACLGEGESERDPIALWCTNEIQGSGWALDDSSGPYETAIREAESRHGVRSANPHRVVRWVSSPDAAVRARYQDALELLALGLVLLPLAPLLAYALTASARGQMQS